MDVVLEGLDTFFFDSLYANILPLPTSPPHQRLLHKQWSNDSFPALRQQPPSFHYEPASQYISFEPSDYAYMSRWPRDYAGRQAISLFLVTWLFGAVIYFVGASLSYHFVFDKTTVQHPKYIRNQMTLEIRQTLGALPWIALMTTPFFLLEVRGYSKMYDATSEGPGWWYNFLQFPFFIMFTDFLIYWIHRGLHHPKIYKHLHKAHHKWVVPTPFASHAFHPVDGFSQSLPYHIFPFLFPLQKFAYIFLFVYINIWTITIHDGEYAMNSKIINGAACHTMHHLYFNFNYGQFTTIWDRLGGSYRPPNEELFRRHEKMSSKEWERQKKEAEEFIKEIEGEDDRVYDEPKETKAAKKVQ